MARNTVSKEVNEERRSRSKKLALIFAVIAVLWYVTAMVVLWMQ
jgi:hypothetical protein